MAAHHKLPFDLLEDHGNVIARRFSLVYRLPDYLRELYEKTLKLSLPAYNGDESWELPMPARFVISRDSIIRSAEADPDYTHRPEPSDTVAALRRVLA